MKINSFKYIIIATSIASVLAVAPAFAATSTVSSSTQIRFAKMQARVASSTAAHIQSGITKGNEMIQQRIDSLNTLISRIQGMKKVSDSDKATVVTSLQAEITDMNSLQTTLDSSTSTTTVKGEVSSITKSYRVYMLVLPQAQIVAAADRILDIASSLNAIQTKIDARLASTTLSASTTSAVQTSLATFSAKISDATTQANAAVSEVSVLKPDNGNTTLAASNKTALKDARSKIVAAQKDLNEARKLIQDAVQAIHSKN